MISKLNNLPIEFKIQKSESFDAVPRADVEADASLAFNAAILMSWASQRRVAFRCDPSVDETEDARPRPIFKRIRAIVAEKMLLFGGNAAR